MNTLRIADALENFGNDPGAAESGAVHLGTRLPRGRAHQSVAVANGKKRSISTESFQAKKRSEGVRPLQNHQQPYLGGHKLFNARVHDNNNAQQQRATNPNSAAGNGIVPNFNNCLPRYSPSPDQLGREDREIAMLRGRVCVKNTDFNTEYDLGGTIGQGTFGKVKKATDKATGDVVAVKMLGGKGFGTNELRAFLNECDILAEIGHDNVPVLHGIYEHGRKYTMIMEYASGGELFERIQSQGSFNEEAAANITRQLLSVLQYIHDRSIAHRDLKPENILFANCERDLAKATVKLIDFGFAKRMAPEPEPVEQRPPMGQSSFQTRLGSPNYVAPEILTSKCGYGCEVDVWSLGVILYIMLCGYFPFYHENERELYRQIRKGSFDMPSEDWAHVSDAAKDLVNSMLKTDPRLRASASDCLRHPWIAKPGVASKQPFPQASRDKLDEFLDSQKKVPKLKKVMDKVFNPFRQSPKKAGHQGNRGPVGGDFGVGPQGAEGEAAAAAVAGKGSGSTNNKVSKESITSPLCYGKDGPSTPRATGPVGCAGKGCSIM
ncbi:serine/threonine protein kinase [Chloropicon roscoffensis]|uniref:Serine/threonine protein kinase n=3 Tax=Chloropicon roscoffensis TaxID=1461544 RepID=A0AAX4P6W2_9CHLO